MTEVNQSALAPASRCGPTAGVTPVLVTDGQERAALAIVRSLGAAGHPVFVCSPRARSLAGASRHARAEAEAPDALADPAGFVEAVDELVDRWGIEVLVPVSEAALLALLPAAGRWSTTQLPFPAAETFRRISDKAEVLAVAAELGIATPAQRVLTGPRALAAAEVDALSYPLVLKPSRSVTETSGPRLKLGVRHAPDPSALESQLASLPPDAYPVLLQQRVIGPGIGIFILLWEGELLAGFAHRRIREKPPAGGVSVYRESIAADPDLLACSRALLDRFDWQGVAMVEYKVDAATGTPYLMEVNGRFWGSLQLAVDAGVDFPALLVAAARRERPAPVHRYRTGVRSRWWWGDVDHLIARLTKSPRSLGLPAGSPGRWRAIRDFLALWHRNDRNEILRARDPAPFLRESIEWLRGG